MGYFSNGTEGDMYEEKYCQSCSHYGPPEGCAVLQAHMVWNYDQHKKGHEALKDVLTTLIPRTADGWNAKCRMYHEAET